MRSIRLKGLFSVGGGRGVLGPMLYKTDAERGNVCEFTETGNFIPKPVFDGSSFGMKDHTLAARPFGG